MVFNPVSDDWSGSANRSCCLLYDDEITTRSELRIVGKCGVCQRQAAVCGVADGMSCCLHFGCAADRMNALNQCGAGFAAHAFDAA
jgi:hypothetical protein